MIEIDEAYIILAVVVFFSAFIGNLLGFCIKEWYDDWMFNKAFEPISKRR